MQPVDHTVDKRGFAFFVVLVALGALALVLGQYAQRPAAAVTVDLSVDQTPPLAAVAASERVIRKLAVADVVPQEGRLIAADLSTMILQLYEDGAVVAEYPIASKGRPGTPWETPSGFYSIQTKEESHYSSIGHVYMPYSMQFFGNYFIHGWPTYPDGTPVSSSFSGGCIRLETADAEKVYAFAKRGTPLFVYDPKPATALLPLRLPPAPAPAVSATAYEVVDLETGSVYAERAAQVPQRMGALSKLMTALVANETISFDRKLTVPQGAVAPDADAATFSVGDLLYPLILHEGSVIADTLADYYGTRGFVGWMNRTAAALDMTSTTFADPAGASEETLTVADDVYRLVSYLSNKKSFVLDIARKPKKTIVAADGTEYPMVKRGEATDIATVATLTVGGEPRRVAIIVLGSARSAEDAQELERWIAQAAPADTAACAACAAPVYRTID